MPVKKIVEYSVAAGSRLVSKLGNASPAIRDKTSGLFPSIDARTGPSNFSYSSNSLRME